MMSPTPRSGMPTNAHQKYLGISNVPKAAKKLATPTTTRTNPIRATPGPIIRNIARAARWSGLFTPLLLLINMFLLDLFVAGPSLLGQERPNSIALRDVSASSGLDFHFDNGSRGRHDLPEIIGGGLGLIDYDGDGL